MPAQTTPRAAITAEELKELGIEASDIASGAVTEPKLASEAVATAKIKKEAVGFTQIAPAGSPVEPAEGAEAGAAGTCRKSAFNIKGNAAKTEWALTHNLATEFTSVTIIKASTKEQGLPKTTKIVTTSANVTTVTFEAAPAAGEVVRVVILG